MANKHRVRLGTRGKAALVGSGVVTAAVALMIGTGAASGAIPIDLPGVPGVTTTVVTPDNLQGFAPSDTRPESSREFSEALGGAAGTAGALRLETVDSAGKTDFFHSGGGAPLAAFAAKFGYSALRSTDSTGAEFQFPALQIVLDFNGPADGGFTTLSFEPIYQTGANAATSSGTFHDYDGSTGVFCSSREIPGVFDANQTRCDNGGTKTLAQIVANNPDATVTAFGVNQGSGNPGIISAVDQLVTPTTTYDFEKTASVTPTDPTTPPGDDDGHHGDGDWGDDGGQHGDGGTWGENHGDSHDDGCTCK